MGRTVSFDLVAKDDVSRTYEKVAGATEALKRKLDAIAAKATKFKIDADDKDARAKMLALQAQLVRLDKSVASPRLDAAGVARAEAQIAAVDAQLDAIGRKKVTATVAVRTDTRQLDSIASKLAKFGPNFSAKGGLLGAGVATLAPAALGIGATALPVLGALAGAFGTGAAGAGAFAAVAVPAYKKIKSASDDLAKAQDAVNKATTNKQRQKALKDEKAILDKLDPAERKAVQNYNDFTDSLGKFEKVNEPKAFSVIGNGFKLIDDNLPKLTPLVQGSSDAFDTLLTKADKALQNPFWTNWFKFLDRQAPKAITTFGESAGNVASGVAGIFQGFEPEETAVENSLVKLTGRFSKFGQDAATGASPGFNQFKDFVDDTAPTVKRTLGDIGKLVGNTITDLEPAVKPALNLVDTASRVLGPIVDTVTAKLPGILDDLNTLATKAEPFLDGLSTGFTDTVASSISTVAGAIEDILGLINKISPGAAKDFGEIVGSALAIAGIMKITGASKVPGYIGKIVGYLTTKKKGTSPLDDAPGKFDKLGGAANTAAGDLDTFSGAKGREKDAMRGNDGLLNRNAAGFENLGEKAEKAGGKLGGLVKQVLKFGALSAPATLPLAITAKDETKAGVSSAQHRVNSLHGKNVDLSATNKAGKAVRAAQKIVNEYHGRGVELSAYGVSGVRSQVQAAQKSVNAFHGRNVLLSISGLSRIRANERVAQGLVDAFHGVTAALKVTYNGVASAVHAAQGIVNSYVGHSAKLSVDSRGVASAVHSAQAVVNSFHGKSATITTNHVDNYVEHHSGGGKVQQQKGLFGPHSDLKKGKNSDVFKLPLPYLDRVPAYARDFELVGATGGKLHGPGTSTNDKIPAMLSNHEWVINARRANELGDAFMTWVNSGTGKIPPNMRAVSPGQFVVNKEQTAKHIRLLQLINAGVQGFAAGGPVIAPVRQIAHYATGGYISADEAAPAGGPVSTHNLALDYARMSRMIGAAVGAAVSNALDGAELDITKRGSRTIATIAHDPMVKRMAGIGV